MRILLCCLGLVACTAPTSRSARGPIAASRSAAVEVVFAPAGPPAVKYDGDAVGLGPTPLAEAILATVTGRGLPVWDGRLAAAALDLAGTVPEDDTLGYAVIEFALHHYGVVEPTPHLFVIFSNRRDDTALARAVGERLVEVLRDRRYHRVGIGVAARGSRRAVMVVLQTSHIDLEPVPRQVAANARVQLRGRLTAPFAEPAVLVTRERGAVENVEVRERRGRFAATIPCNGDAVMRIEVSGVSSEGSSVLANFPVYCGRAPPVELRSELTGAVDLSDIDAVERRLVELTNEDRRRAGLPPLAIDPEVAQVARTYSEEMARTGEVVHVSPRSGAADDRLRAAGIRRPLVQENLARAATPEEVHRSLMNSPGHRANILSERATHIGVGVVAAAARDLFVTQLFTRIPPRVDLGRARSVLVERVRKALGVRVDATLHQIAQTHARQFAERGSGEAEQIRSSSAIQELSQFRGVRVMVMAVADIDQLGPDKLPRVKGASHIGIGVAQGEHEVLGEGAIYIVLLVGVAR